MPLREAVQRIPLDQAIELVKDARSLLDNAQTFLGPAAACSNSSCPSA